MAPSRAGLRAWVLLPLASCAVFWSAAAVLAPELVGRRSADRRLSDADRRDVLASLDAARRIYSDLFASGGAPALLDEFPATRAIKHRVFRDIGFLRDRGLVEVNDLAEAIPLSVEPTGRDTAEAVVYEEWNFLVQRASDRAPLSDLKGMAGGFRYGLSRAPDGRWVITSWEPVEVARPATPPEFKY